MKEDSGRDGNQGAMGSPYMKKPSFNPKDIIMSVEDQIKIRTIDDQRL
jgi:hypothetical protein